MIEGVLFTLMVMAFAALVIGAIVYQFWARAQREKRMRAWAEAKGWSYTPIEKQLERSFRGMVPYGQGSGRYARHVVRGAHFGYPFVMFQYEYTVSTGKSSHTHHFRVLRLQMPIDGRGLTIQKEHVGHKLMDALGGEDIDFESAEFSKRFWVQCRDRRFAYDVITPDMMEFLMPPRGAHWQWFGTTLQVHMTGRMEPDAAARLLARGVGFTDRLPRHLLATP